VSRPGEGLPEGYDPTSGDIVFVHRPDSVIPVLMSSCQHLRFRGRDRTHAKWNHAAMVVSSDAAIIESLTRVRERDLTGKYFDYTYVIVRPETDERERRHMTDFLKWVEGLSQGADPIRVISVVWGLLTGGRLTANMDGTEYSSTLVAEALKTAGYRFNRRTVMPADLSWYFNVPLAASGEGAVDIGSDSG